MQGSKNGVGAWSSITTARALIRPNCFPPPFPLGGQQQRLCLARALAVRPDVLLMDEPASALDPIATLKIEELINELVEQYTIVIVTHNMQQAGRVSQFTGFFLSGRLIEQSPTVDLFEHPTQQETENYISGRFS